MEPPAATPLRRNSDLSIPAHTDSAKIALRRWQREGKKNLDPDNDVHVQAYNQLRMLGPSVTAKKLVAFLKNAKSAMSVGTTTEEAYWLVPKINFPSGLPPDINDCVVDPNALESSQLRAEEGGTVTAVDSDNFWVVDKAIDRSILGKGTYTLKFWGSNHTKCNLNPSGSSDAISGAHAINKQLPNAVPEPPIEIIMTKPQAAIPGQPQAAIVPNTAIVPMDNSSRELPRCPSDASEDPIDKCAKRRKTLTDTLTKLRSDVKDAAAKHMWWSDNTWNNDTVAVLMGDLLEVIKEIVEDKKNTAGIKGVDALLNKVTVFLQDIFCSKPMFEHVHHFQYVFPKLQKMGGEMTGIGRLITMLGEVGDKGPGHFNMTNVDTVDRIAFRGTPLFQSYCENVFSNELDKARTALFAKSGSATEGEAGSATGGQSGCDALADWSATGGPSESNIADCKRHLEFALQVRPVNQGLIDTAQCCLKMFCSGAQQRDLLEYFHHQPILVGKFLDDWAPRAPISLAARMLSEHCSFSHSTFGDLVNWAVPNSSLINVLITGCQITDCQITDCNIFTTTDYGLHYLQIPNCTGLTHLRIARLRIAKPTDADWNSQGCWYWHPEQLRHCVPKPCRGELLHFDRFVARAVDVGKAVSRVREIASAENR